MARLTAEPPLECQAHGRWPSACIRLRTCDCRHFNSCAQPALQVASLAPLPAAADDLSDYLSPSKRQRLSAGSLLRVESDVSDLVRCARGLRCVLWARDRWG